MDGEQRLREIISDRRFRTTHSVVLVCPLLITLYQIDDSVQPIAGKLEILAVEALYQIDDSVQPIARRGRVSQRANYIRSTIPYNP